MSLIQKHLISSLALIASLLLSACGSGGGDGDNSTLIDATTSELSNKYISFQTNSSNNAADAFLTGTRELYLCGTGQFFRLDETLLFSSDVGSFDINDSSIGTWSISAQNGGAVLDLLVEDTTDSALTLPALRSFNIQLDVNGSVFVNGVAADVQAADCSAVL